MPAMHDSLSTTGGKNGPIVEPDRVRGLAEAQARPSITADWNPLREAPITGVRVCDVKNVVYRNGALTEIYRPEWFAGEFNVQHVILATILPGEMSQWHCHHQQKDIIFPIRGFIRIGLYDARPDSPTFGISHVQTFHLQRPRYVCVPTGVWHALRNIGHEEAQYIVLNDLPYEYEHPDDWTLPAGAPAIPVSL